MSESVLDRLAREELLELLRAERETGAWWRTRYAQNVCNNMNNKQRERGATK